MADDEVPYGVANWPEQRGNHRVRIRVSEPSDAVQVHVPWRRRDRRLVEKGLLLLDASTGAQITNIALARLDRESADLVFAPPTVPGTYELYTMPLAEAPPQHVEGNTDAIYLGPRETADAGWMQRHVAAQRWRRLPEARVVDIQARTEFDSFHPMEVIATASETHELVSRHGGKGYLLFSEDRKFPIRMSDDLPLRWVRTGPFQPFRGQALRNEFYVFQIGLYACGQSFDEVVVSFEPLRCGDGPSIPSAALRCFNKGGTDWLGRRFNTKLGVPKGAVQALWCGVQIPGDAAPGVYRGRVTIEPAGAEATAIELAIAVSDTYLKDSGDGELWRLSRLRWLDSTLGLEDEVTHPYTPLQVDGPTIRCLGRSVTLDAATALPAGVNSQGMELLAAPVELVVRTAAGDVRWRGGETRIVRSSSTTVVAESDRDSDSLKLAVRFKMEFDGHITLALALQAIQDIEIKDTYLQIPVRKEAAEYMVGMKRRGGVRPGNWSWKWNLDESNNAVWIGNVRGGLHCKLKGPEDTWEFGTMRASGLPEGWDNDGKGGCQFDEGADAFVMRAYTGDRRLAAGQVLNLRAGMMVTPVKPITRDHWSQRYYHQGEPSMDQVRHAGATIINIHHAGALNPNINYPFIEVEALKAYVNEAHARGLKVKIYYTARELSNRVTEIWALRSLGDEVFQTRLNSELKGYSWLQEHLVSGYIPAWHARLPSGEIDGAWLPTGLSRWHNYYLEGIRWLLENAEIDGLYLDAFGFDREIMKRVRRIVDRYRPGCLIDFHSGDNYKSVFGWSSTTAHDAEHFPFIDSIWFGETYVYNEAPPDLWLIEISGIPFGLMGDTLPLKEFGGDSPWRAMVYGMTSRIYRSGRPQEIWKFWDAFGIRESEMIGYWDQRCPVKTDHPKVLVTVYRRRSRSLISLASWAQDPVKVQLSIDWDALGLKRGNTRLVARPIAGFQDAATFKADARIPVEPAKGWLLVLEAEAP